MSESDECQIDVSVEIHSDPVPRGVPSAFEKLITDQPPVLESLIAQLPTQSILALFHTSSYLNNFLKKSPTSWRYVSWQLYAPALTTVNASPTNNASGLGPRQSSNYALDQLLLYVVNPFSTRLTSINLDNTAVSGSTLFQTVMVLRKDTLEHISVRGCKNVSLKYHINPWLTMHAMAAERPQDGRAPGFEKLALKSLYTYRCRHHRRRPYLPSSLARKESDSEPTHELVLTCHKLGIWTDTAWCTTPGQRCFRRKGYVTMRSPQDPREVWVVYDRLWRSRNWLGPVPDNRSQTTPASPTRKRKRDCRSWEFSEEAMNGESIATKGEGKSTPAHLRKTHRQFVEDIYCDNCSDPILERCEQCSVMMHCSGCRKTLCASCAFDRPYLRNKMASEEERNKFWWAPGCAVSPCSMLDQDPSTPIPAGNGQPPPPNSSSPSIKFRWCCTEPIFSGGGGISFGSTQSRDPDRIRAAPLRAGEGWEDPEFSHHSSFAAELDHPDVFGEIGVPLTRTDVMNGPGGRWPSIDSLFRRDAFLESDHSPATVPRILCDDCYRSDQWKMKCKTCSVPLCLKHDVRDRLKVRICGYKDLVVEKAEFRSRQKALKLLTMLMLKRRSKKLKALEGKQPETSKSESAGGILESTLDLLDEATQAKDEDGLATPRPTRTPRFPHVVDTAELNAIRGNLRTPISEAEAPNRPLSPGSNSTGPPSRTSSPTPSARSVPATPEPNSSTRRNEQSEAEHPVWKGCQSFFCPSGVRPAGDHRRRCVAVMRQCGDCKIYVCEQCTSDLEPPCPCTGCRITGEEGQTDASAEGNLRFFCPNCRWARMVNGKCKRKPISASTKSKARKNKKNKNRIRKPLEERRGQRPTVPGTAVVPAVDTVDGLVDFFEGLYVNEHADISPESSVTASGSVPAQGEEIRELEDMGALARDLIRRIQTLRQQFGPGSLAALALPDIRVDDNGNVQQHLIPSVQPVAETQNLPTEPEQQIQPDHEAQASSSGSGA